MKHLIALILFVATSSVSLAETDRWIVSGQGYVGIDELLLERLLDKESVGEGRPENSSVTIEWPEATFTDRSGVSISATLILQFHLGDTYPVGQDTEYPGLITVINEGSGQLAYSATGRTFSIRMTRFNSTIGRAIHSDSQGPLHLAFDIFADLIDDKTDLVVAQHNLVIAVDLENRSAPTVRDALILGISSLDALPSEANLSEQKSYSSYSTTLTAPTVDDEKIVRTFR